MTRSDVLDLPTPGGGGLPRLAPGTELLGQYQDSGYREPRFLIRRADGQVMQLPRLLYRVAGSLDGRDAHQVAAALSAELDQDLTAEQIAFLVEDRLRPVGLLAPEHAAPGAAGAAADRGEPPVRADPLLALRFRAGLVPPSVAWRIGGFFRPLFTRPAWITFVTGFVAVDVWIVAQGALLDRSVAGVQEVARQPALILAILALTVVGAAFHECGHVTACRYGGGRPGNLGVGLYVIWPAFYSTVTDSYRLNRVGRVRTDLGGIYFNAVFMLGLGLVYADTGRPWLLLALYGMHVQTAWQFLPSLRMDGYYILADLVGVPDLFGLVRPALAGLIPGRPADPRLHDLTPRARRWVRAWVLVVIPSLLLWLVVLLLAAPRLLPAAWQATLSYLQHLDAAARQGDVLGTALGTVQLLLLALPWVGLLFVLLPLFRIPLRVLAPRWAVARGTRIRAPARAAVRRAVALGGLVVLAALLVVRVARVAAGHAGTDAESRLVDSALAALHRVTGPPVAPDEWLVRLQLIGYARLTGAFERHDSVLTGGRELAALATGVLAACLVALVAIRRLSPAAGALPLVGLLIMGPTVTTLATVGPGVVGAAWAALGTLVLVLAPGRTAAVLGVLATAVGVATAPVVAVPLAVGVAVLAARGAPGPARRDTVPPQYPARHPATGDPGRWLAVALVFPVAAFGGVLAGGGRLPVDAAQRTVFLVLVGLLVGVGLLVRRARLWAAVAGSAAILGALPWSAAGSALPVALATVVVLAAVLVEAFGGSGAEPTHPLLRVAVGVPVLVLVVAGALFPPPTTAAAPHAALAAWITGPRSPGEPIRVPASLWGDLVRDGVPPARLVRTADEPAPAAAWTVTVGGPPAARHPRIRFGSGATALTVSPPVEPAPGGGAANMTSRPVGGD